MSEKLTNINTTLEILSTLLSLSTLFYLYCQSFLTKRHINISDLTHSKLEKLIDVVSESERRRLPSGKGRRRKETEEPVMARHNQSEHGRSPVLCSDNNT